MYVLGLPIECLFYYCRWFKLYIIEGKEFYDQAVMPFILPIKHFGDVKHLYCAVKACDMLKQVDIFESDILQAAIQHHWNTQGWHMYVANLIQYALTIFMFVVSIYSYQTVTWMDNPNPEALKECQLALAAFMVFMCLFALNELSQVIGKYVKLHNQNWTMTRIFGFGFTHFLCDVWNVIDCSVVVTGLMGARGRYAELAQCYDSKYYEHVAVFDGQFVTKFYCDLPGNKKESLTSCLLAATAVLLWFKLLYFLKPIKAAGQFGKCFTTSF
jgi:hypothetical protein